MKNYKSKALLKVGTKSERKEKGLQIQIGTFGLSSRFESFWEKFRCQEILAKKVPKEENELAGTEGLKKLLTEILRTQSYTGFWLYDLYKDGRPVGRIPVRNSNTLKKVFSFALENGYSVLNRGFFVIPREVWEDYKKNYQKGDFASNLRIGLAVFREQRLTRLAPYILIDLDNTSEEDLKRLIKYLHKIGIYPEVWQSASGNGYHIYIKLIGNYATKYDIVKGKKIKTTYRFLPYASDYRIPLCIKGLSRICKQLGIKPDFISVSHAVWEEGLPNPIKEGKASQKVFRGRPHRLDKLTEKLRPLWEAELREEVRQKFLSQVRAKPKKNKENEQEKGYYARAEVQETECSNPKDYLQANISTAFRMLDRGYTWAEIEAELRDHWHGDPKAFDRAFKGFQKWIEDHYKPLKTRRKPPKQRKHKHYWEYVDAIHEVLKRKPNASIREIAKATGIPKSSIGDILKVFTREQILTDPEQVKEYLRANEKGGDRLTEKAKEELREKGKERFRKFFEEFLKQALRPKPKTEKRKNRLKESVSSYEGHWLSFSELVVRTDDEGVRIGHISITPSESREEDGLVPPEKPEKIFPPITCPPRNYPQVRQRINALLDLVKEVFLKTKPLPEGDINFRPQQEMLKAIGYSGTFTPAPLWQEMATWCYAELLKRDIVALDGSRFDEERLERERPEIVEKLLELFYRIAKRYNSAGAPTNEPSAKALNERTITEGAPAEEDLSSETEAKGYTDGAPRGQQKALFTFLQTGQTSTTENEDQTEKRKRNRRQEVQKQTDDEWEELWERYLSCDLDWIF